MKSAENLQCVSQKSKYKVSINDVLWINKLTAECRLASRKRIIPLGQINNAITDGIYQPRSSKWCRGKSHSSMTIMARHLTTVTAGWYASTTCGRFDFTSVRRMPGFTGLSMTKSTRSLPEKKTRKSQRHLHLTNKPRTWRCTVQNTKCFCRWWTVGTLKLGELVVGSRQCTSFLLLVWGAAAFPGV